MISARRLLASLSVAAVAATPALVATGAEAATESVTLAGSLQSELGCPDDWQPGCEATMLDQQGDSPIWTGEFRVPAGTYAFKVALDGGWDENYGAGGAAGGADIPLVLEGPARLRFTYDDTSHETTFTPLDLAGGTTRADARLAGDSRRDALTRERFYFVMADRFANGSRANDRGGLTGGRLETGFDPSDKAFYHGGDLAGLTDKLGYIKKLGTTAIWLTPSFKNKPVQGGPGQESAGYHGYWVTDFTRIDPHLGTNAEMEQLIDAAHKKGMKVFFDIITNHTADVIDYREKTYTYRNKKAYPYRDAAGEVFDDRDYVNRTFPAMDPATSFPYTPFFPTKADETVKVPAWLNDPLMYHNRGDSTFAGESSTYGDFIGLDDLFTERPEVVDGMGEIYKTWVDLGIDGFRIDTVKHVNLEFWQRFMPDLLGHADAVGNDDFFAFGEVFDGNPQVMSQYTTAGRLQATLDFGFQQQGVDFAKGKSAAVLADFFAQDDWYTDPDSNAYQLPTFLGNHDMGRVAMFLQDSSANPAEHLARVKLADALMFTSRGNPVTYYGDEQGFIGTGGDQLAREDMFATRTPQYAEEPVLAGPSGSRDRFDTGHPLFRHIADLSKLREKHPALADGAQIQRYAADGAGVFAFSRYDDATGREYLVVANNGTSRATAEFDTWTTRGAFSPLWGGGRSARPDARGGVRVSVPALSVRVLRASRPISTRSAAPQVTMTTEPGATLYDRVEVGADVATDTFAQTTFLYRPVGTATWRPIGTDDNAPFRVFHDVSGMPKGSVLEYRAVTRDAAGRLGTAGSWGVVGDAPKPPPSDVELGDPVTQPTSVGVPGTHNSEMGCAADWQETCDASQLALDADDGIWKKSFSIPAGGYGYKAAIDRSWTENYGAKGERDGANISYDTDGTVTFYYDHATHWATSDEEGPIITAPGAYQIELGCPTAWDPSCMRPWLQDEDGDGTYSWATTRIPAGTWEFKIAHGLSWDENYGAGGARDGSNVSFTVPADGAKTTFVYDSATHVVTVSSS